MKPDQAIEQLKRDINVIFTDTKKKRKNIFRGHSRSISSDIEDNIAIFLSNILPEHFNYYLDMSIKVNGKINRPDLLIVNSESKVVAMIEIKANMGYCRDASKTVDKIVQNHQKFANQSELGCKINEEQEVKLIYNNDVRLFLLSLTERNCPLENHNKNKQYAAKLNVNHYNLFSGWYDELSNHDIDQFINDLATLM